MKNSLPGTSISTRLTGLAARRERLHAGWLWLTQPAGIASLDERRRSRLVNSILLVTSLLLAVRTMVETRQQSIYLLITLLCFGAYLLGRSGRTRAAAWGAAVMLSLPSFVEALETSADLTENNIFHRFAYLAVPVVLSSLVLPPWQLALVTALNLAALIGISAGLLGLPPFAWLPVSSFIAILALLIGMVMRAHDLMEQDRRSQERDRDRRLNDVTRAIAGALDVDAVLETVVRLAVELSGAEAGLLSLTSRDGERIEQAHSHNMAPAPDNHQPPKGQGLAWEVILTRRPLLLDDYHQHPRRMGTLERAALRAYLGVPLLTGEQCLGALAVACTAPERRFTPRDLETLQTVASQAGIAIQNARLYRELSEELAERRRMEDALQQRDVILEAVAFAAGQFLRSQDWQGYIQTVLAELGQITNSSHAYIFQNHPGPDGRTVTSQLYQWTRPGDQPTLAMAEFLNVPLEGPGLERWRQAMLDGEPFYGSRSTFLPGEERFLAPLGAQSILEMPIYLRAEFRRPAPEADMEWWGMIGFDDYTAERRWSAAEVDAIRIAASIFSAAIQRQRADEAMRQREDIYRRAISSADAVPYLQEYSPNRFVFMGEGITHLLGYTAAEVTPQLWKTHVDQANMLGSAAHLSEPQAYELARAGQLPNWRCDYLMRTRSGEQRWIADSGVELIGPDGLSYGCIGILQDVTDRKRVEQAAQQANQELERRVQERTSALETANREMESFAYSVSHDLRAPLRAIDGYSSILMQDHLSGLDEDAQACLDNIRQATLKMNQLIDDLLQLSRVTRAEMQTVAVDLSELAAEWKRVRQAQEPERTVRLAIQPGLQAAGDPNLLRIALGNLLDNAWKFTRRSSEPRIEIGCQDQPGPDGLQCTVYFVRDNGAGFDMRYAGRLFQAFQRLHNPSEFEGTGVGLATVQRVVRRHHGQVWAEGQVDGGATFYFTLGKAPAEPPA